jgi:hypothetical protein
VRVVRFDLIHWRVGNSAIKLNEHHELVEKFTGARHVDDMKL